MESAIENARENVKRTFDFLGNCIDILVPIIISLVLTLTIIGLILKSESSNDTKKEKPEETDLSDYTGLIWAFSFMKNLFK